MKNVCTLMILILSVILSGCGVVGDGSCVGECSTKEKPSEQGGINLSRLSVFSVDNEFLGYATDYHFDYVKMYIPAYLSYVTIHPVSGEYLEQPVSFYEEIYFNDRECTGNAVMLNWSGKIGSTYIRAKNQRTYVVNSTTYYSELNLFHSQSKLVANRPASDSCMNVNYPIETYAANLVEADSMPDLSPYAPFSLFQENNNDSD